MITKTFKKYTGILGLSLTSTCALAIDCSGPSDDTQTIQDAINLLTNGGELVIENTINGSWACETSAPIIVKSGVKLICKTGTIINSNYDIDVVALEENGSIENCEIVNSSTSFTKALLKISAINKAFTQKRQKTGASNLVLRGKDTGNSGYGIHLYANGSAGNSWIQWAQFRNINIHNVGECIRLEAIENSGYNGYVNGNIFDGITCDFAYYGIRTSNSGSGVPATNGNQFTNFQFHARKPEVFTDGTERAIELSHNSSHNFIHMDVWDWGDAEETTAVADLHLGTSGGNTFLVNGVKQDEIQAENQYSIFMGDKIPDTPRNFWITDLPDASFNKGRMIYIQSNDHQNLAWSNGTLWKEIGGLKEYTPADFEFTGSTVPLTPAHIGQGVYWTNRDATGPVTFDLAQVDAKPGAEVIFRNFTADIKITPQSGDKFYDPITNEFSPGSQMLEYNINHGYIHLRSYTNNVWTIVATQGRRGAANWIFN